LIDLQILNMHGLEELEAQVGRAVAL
jgi:hypothetical protein